jgi:hypothetical protein
MPNKLKRDDICVARLATRRRIVGRMKKTKIRGQRDGKRTINLATKTKIKAKIEMKNTKTIHKLRIQTLYTGNAIKRDMFNTTDQKTTQTWTSR